MVLNVNMRFGFEWFNELLKIPTSKLMPGLPSSFLKVIIMHSTTTIINNTVNVKSICTLLFSYFSFNKIRLYHDFFVFLVSTTTQ